VDSALCWLGALGAEATVLVVNVEVVRPCAPDSSDVPYTPFPFTAALGTAGSVPLALCWASGGWLWVVWRSGAPHGSSGYSMEGFAIERVCLGVMAVSFVFLDGVTGRCGGFAPRSLRSERTGLLSHTRPGSFG
jgi:hypothetical protein